MHPAPCIPSTPHTWHPMHPPPQAPFMPEAKVQGWPHSRSHALLSLRPRSALWMQRVSGSPSELCSAPACRSARPDARVRGTAALLPCSSSVPSWWKTDSEWPPDRVVHGELVQEPLKVTAVPLPRGAPSPQVSASKASCRRREGGTVPWLRHAPLWGTAPPSPPRTPLHRRAFPVAGADRSGLL